MFWATIVHGDTGRKDSEAHPYSALKKIQMGPTWVGPWALVEEQNG